MPREKTGSNNFDKEGEMKRILILGIILVTMLLPVFFVSGRHMQVERRMHHAHRHGADHNRLWIDDLRPGKVSNVDLAIETRLTDAD